MRSPLASRLSNLPPSILKHFLDVANELKGEVLSLSIGEPDFATPWGIVDAGMKAMEEGWTHYSPNTGYRPLREAISSYIALRYGVHYDPQTEVMATVGGSEALDLAMRSLLDPGDEVLIPEPAFVSYHALARLVDAQVQTLPLVAENGFRLDPERLRAALSPKTRLLIVSYPNNPTGAVMSHDDWAQVAEVLEAFPNLYIVTDELYEAMDYSQDRPASLIQFPHLRDRIIYIGGFSKAYAMTGWRLGYVLAPPFLIDALTQIHQYAVMCSPSMAQMAGVVALSDHDEDVATMRRTYDARRRRILHALESMALPIYPPQGAFYAFPSIQGFGLDSLQFCERLLAEERVALIPGIAFGPSGEGHVRISYATDEATLDEAMRRLHRFVHRLRHEI